MLADLVTEYIRQQYAAGKTQEEIGKSLNVPHAIINRIISGKRSAAKMYIGTFDKMFPKAVVSLTGSPVTIGPAVTGDRNTVTGVNNFFSPSGGAAAPPEVAAVLSSPLPPSEKAAILHEIYALKNRKEQK